MPWPPPIRLRHPGRRLAWLPWAVAGLLGLALASADGLQAAWAYLHVHDALLRAWHAEQPLQVACAFCVVFALLSALAVPGCSVLALGAGALFGPWAGAALVSLASAAGATLPFLAARHWWREPARRRLGSRLAAMDERVGRDGALTLLSLRLAPVVPFAVLNPLMGLTTMPAWTFFWVSAVGMLAGSAVYTAAGAGLVQSAGIESAGGSGLWLAAAALAAVPWLWRAWTRRRQRRGQA